MNILYGVAGEGLGHAVRSRPLIEHLQKFHNVKVVVSGNAYKFLKDKVNNVNEITGMHIDYKNNEVRSVKTPAANIAKADKLIFKNFFTALKVLKGFKPDVVITDFEMLSYFIGKFRRIPVICLDNNHALTHLKIDKIKSGARFLGTLVVQTRNPGCSEYIITSFFDAQPKNKKVKIFPPLLREEMINAVSEEKEHILVYQTSTSFKKQLVDVFIKFPKEKFIVYGFNKHEQVLNTFFRENSEDEFIDNLRTCKAVITNGGFTLMTEAFHLGKPVLSIPIKKHHEQAVNAHYAEKLGYGMRADDFTDETLKKFISNIEQYKTKLKSYRKSNNNELISYIERRLGELPNFNI